MSFNLYVEQTIKLFIERYSFDMVLFNYINMGIKALHF